MKQKHATPRESIATKGVSTIPRWLVALFGIALGLVIMGTIWSFWMRHNTQHVVTKTITRTIAAASNDCKLTNLSISLGRVDGTAGTHYQHVILTNKGTTTCDLSGYPLVFLVNGSGAVLGHSADIPTPPSMPAAITLAPGAQAYTAVGFPQAANFESPTACSAASTKLRLYLGSNASYLETAIAKPNCPGFSVTAFAAGS